ncbi:hypothetical protein ACI6PS_01675 [Flavobacterium sp. PLA-1-15]|uniref:hypothetical protein n=1 Tax=Flavobacterium sp. PLA-1-15 TaxID=3380533 RepID=UPI003B76745E
MTNYVRVEEYSTLGDFIGKSYDRDLDLIVVRYPKLGKPYRDGFLAKLNEVKTLEGALFMTEEQKKATLMLYQVADYLGDELNFINTYLKEAGLDTKAVTALKKDLSNDNIEGAVLKIENVKQFLTEHRFVLEQEGMRSNFPQELGNAKEKLEDLNSTQNVFMNKLKALTSENKAVYTALYAMIAKIANAGKLVFKDDVKKDEYVIKKIVSRMRSHYGGKKE